MEPAGMEASREMQFESGMSEREELIDMVQWAYGKLNAFSFSKQEDALMLDSMRLYLEFNAPEYKGE